MISPVFFVIVWTFNVIWSYFWILHSLNPSKVQNKSILFGSNKQMLCKYNSNTKPNPGQHHSSFHLLLHSNAGLVFLFPPETIISKVVPFVCFASVFVHITFHANTPLYSMGILPTGCRFAVALFRFQIFKCIQVFLVSTI